MLITGNSLAVQRIGLCTFTANCLGSISSQVTKIPHALQPEVGGGCCSVAQSSPSLCNSMDCSTSCSSLSPGVHSDSHPSSQWCHPAISSPVVPFSSCPQSLPASESFWMSQLFTRGGQSTGVSASASFQRTPRTDLQNGLVGSPCSPRDSQESSPTPQFKSISSLALSFLHSLTLTSIHDHWKNHSLD